MSSNKISSSIPQNPQSDDLSYSEKMDKNEYENTDNEENSSIKFGISKEELEAFSNGTNLELFEKKDLKFKAKKLIAYVKNGEINCNIKVRNLVFGLSTLIFCILLFLLASNSLARSQTILNEPQQKIQEIAPIQKVEQKSEKNDLNAVASIAPTAGAPEIKKDEPQALKQLLNGDAKVQNQKSNQLIAEKQKSKQGSKQKKQSNLKTEQPKDVPSKAEVKQAKASQEKKITVTDVPKPTQKQKLKIQEKPSLPAQNVKATKEQIAAVKVENKKTEEPLNIKKSESAPVVKPVQKKKDKKSKKEAKK